MTIIQIKLCKPCSYYYRLYCSCGFMWTGHNWSSAQTKAYWILALKACLLLALIYFCASGNSLNPSHSNIFKMKYRDAARKGAFCRILLWVGIFSREVFFCTWSLKFIARSVETIFICSKFAVILQILLYTIYTAMYILYILQIRAPRDLYHVLPIVSKISLLVVI